MKLTRIDYSRLNARQQEAFNFQKHEFHNRQVRLYRKMREDWILN
ncbi:hypothetical protein [Marinospirillum celere]|nr:hypothetical protein [Marinospirillum celere]